MAKRPPGKRSPWLPGDLKPLRSRKGVYERDAAAITGEQHVPTLNYFDGKSWHIAAPTVEAALKKPISGYQDLRWRGLAENPKIV